MSSSKRKRESGTVFKKSKTNKEFTSIEIPNSVACIGVKAFEGCTQLTSITIPDSVARIRHEAFYGCSGLTSIIIADSVTSIGGQSFAGSSVSNRHYYALSGCTGLISVSFPSLSSIFVRLRFRDATNRNKSSHLLDFIIDSPE